MVGPISSSPSDAYDDDSPYWPGANVSANNVSWYEAAQFVNWLNTSKGRHAVYKFTGTQGTGDYTLATWAAAEADNSTNLYRHKDAFYYLATEDEWVKAAYWNGSDLQTYANKSPDDLVSGEPDPAKWNYDPSAGDEPWNVDRGVEELNGAHNMMGNVWEWMESPSTSGNYTTGSNRVLRGGPYYGNVDSIASYYRNYANPNVEDRGVGFRVAAVPEPATLGLFSLGALALLRRGRQL